MTIVTNLIIRTAAVLMAASCTVGCKSNQRISAAPARVSAKSDTSSRPAQIGLASVYKDHRTASGEPYRASALACAHKTFPLGSRVKVTNLNNGRSVVARVNDRGPYIKGRIVDLTPAAASRIGLGWSIAKVKVERL